MSQEFNELNEYFVSLSIWIKAIREHILVRDYTGIREHILIRDYIPEARLP
jgi:hypothetical protein